MDKISLRVYNQQIESMISEGKLEEAIAHCHHILDSYSMHIETYRLLGKAFLESRRYGDATDIFQRVLNAVPDDFVSHVGMSIIRDDENKRDEAIWHMERAFEVQPSNPAIQNELRRLYGRRDGMEPTKIRLSRDALANMYAQGELFVQAIAELRAILADDPNRPDLQVMLARAYMRAGQKVEAADVAAQLLRKYPYCMDALRVLVEVLPGTSRAENTQIYRQRLKMMDPYLSFATGSVFEADKVADGAVSLERLEYKASRKPQTEQPIWATTLGVKLEDDKKPESQMDWLLGKGGQTGEEIKPLAPDSSSAAGVKDTDIPEFLRDAGWNVPASSPAENQPTEEPSLPGESIAKAEMPDWLKAMAPPEMARNEEVPQESISEGEDDLPAWLAGLGITAEAEKGEGKKGTAPFIEGEEILVEFPDQEEPGEEEKGGPVSEAEPTPASPEVIPLESGEVVETLIPDSDAPSPDEMTRETIVEIPESMEDETELPTEKVVLSELPTNQSTPSEPLVEPPVEPQPGTEAAFPDWLTGITPAALPGENEESSKEPAEEGDSAAESTPPEIQAEEIPEPPVEIASEQAQDALPAAESQLPDWLFEVEETPGSISEPTEEVKHVESPLQENLPAELQAELDDQTLPVIGEETESIKTPAKKENFPDWMAGLFADSAPSADAGKPIMEPLVELSPSTNDLQVESNAIDSEPAFPVPEEAATEEPVSVPNETLGQAENDSLLEGNNEGEPGQITSDVASIEETIPGDLGEDQGEGPVQDEVKESTEQSAPTSTAQFPEWMASLGAAAGVIGGVESLEETDKRFISEEDLLTSTQGHMEAAGESPVPPGEVHPEETGSSVPKPINIEDDTLAWLEGLAARQGAKDEELLTEPGDRPQQLPDWLRDFAKEQAARESGSLPEEAAKDQPEGAFAPGVPPIQEGSGEEVKLNEIVDQPIGTESPAVDLKQALEEATPAEEDASLKWLDNLEARHGLMSVGQDIPDEKRPDEFEDWLKGLDKEKEKSEEIPNDNEEPGPAVDIESLPALETSDQVSPADQNPIVESEGKPAGLDELPAWLNEGKVEEPSHEITPDIETVQVPSQLDVNLPDWMKDIQPPVSEPEKDKEIIPADLPEWLRKPEEPSAEVQTSEQEPESWPPGESETPVIEEATAPEEWVPSEQTATSPEDAVAPSSAVMVETAGEATAEISSVEATPTPAPSQDKEALLLADARGALEENEPAESMKAYSALIRRNRYIEEIIEDLRKASDRHPVDSIVWQTLGDAYMRAGRLQEALDAYTKAEELLK